MSVGFAGYGGSLVAYIAREKRVIAIDFDSRAPLAYRPELYTEPEDRRYSCARSLFPVLSRDSIWRSNDSGKNPGKTLRPARGNWPRRAFPLRRSFTGS